MKTICLLLVLISNCLYSQEHKSIHQLHTEAYSHNLEEPQITIQKQSDIIPLNKNVISGLNKAVFGFLPDWEYSNAKNTLRYDLLTHIAAFDFPVSSAGVISFPSGWGNSTWKEIINTAHANGVKIIMTAVNFKGTDIHTIITNSTVKNAFFENAKKVILDNSLDGINIDFESLNTADRGSLINTFMKELTTYLHSAIPGTEVSFAGPAINWSGWDLPGLANSCDYIFIMGYDFYGSWSTTTGPSAPLTGGSNNITTTITSTTKGYANVVSVSPKKLILGVPYYGNKWTAKTSSALSEVITYKGSTRFKDDALSSPQHGRLWENTYKVPWYRYQINNEWYQVWYDDQESIGLKYDLAISKNLKGIGMWALGYDGTRNELWEVIEQKFKPVLPVEMISFNASMTDKVIELKWRTASELNNFGFDIERRKHSEEEFRKIGFMPGHGSSAEIHEYVYKDHLYNQISGKLEYRLKQLDSNGNYSYSSIVEVNLNPREFSLEQNYPNPFNPTTIIEFQVPYESLVTLRVFDILGKEVSTLINNRYEPGSYRVDFSGLNLSDGTYIYSLTAGGLVLTKKMMLIR